MLASRVRAFLLAESLFTITAITFDVCHDQLGGWWKVSGVSATLAHAREKSLPPNVYRKENGASGKGNSLT